MSVQGFFNEEALRSLPRVYELIKRADRFDKSQMISRTLRTIMNCSPALAEMSQQQRKNLECHLIEIFEFNGWVSK